MKFFIILCFVISGYVHANSCKYNLDIKNYAGITKFSENQMITKIKRLMKKKGYHLTDIKTPLELEIFVVCDCVRDDGQKYPGNAVSINLIQDSHELVSSFSDYIYAPLTSGKKAFNIAFRDFKLQLEACDR